MIDSDMRELGIQHQIRLREEQIERVHGASLEIMSRVGMRFYDEEALTLFERAGAKITDDNLVHIPSRLVEWALQVAPKNVTIYNRYGESAMELGGYRTYFGVGSDCMHIYDLESGERRKAVLDDVVRGVRLVDALPNIDFVMSMFMPADVPREYHERHQMAVMLRETDKPIVFVGEEEASTVYAISMAAAVAGSMEQLAQYPFVINYVNAVSSFRHNEDSVRRLLYAAEHNIPSVYSPGNSCGILSPVTTMGALALTNAGQLGGLVLTQLKREGAPFIRGNPNPERMDLRTMVSLYGAPDSGPFGWDLAHHQGLPIFGAAGCSDAKVFDAQAAAEASLTLFANAIGGANLIHDVGYLDSAMTGSLELVAFCDEIIGWLKRYLRPPEIDCDRLALDIIEERGPDGTFLDAEHTLSHMREDWMPSLLDRFEFVRWSDQGKITLQERANEKVHHILENHRPKSLPEESVEAIESVLGSGQIGE